MRLTSFRPGRPVKFTGPQPPVKRKIRVPRLSQKLNQRNGSDLTGPRRWKTRTISNTDCQRKTLNLEIRHDEERQRCETSNRNSDGRVAVLEKFGVAVSLEFFENRGPSHSVEAVLRLAIIVRYMPPLAPEMCLAVLIFNIFILVGIHNKWDFRGGFFPRTRWRGA